MSSKAGKAKPKREEVYWDSPIFIEHIGKKHLNRKPLVDHLVGMAKAGEILVVTSALTRGEVLQGPAGLSLPEEHKRWLRNFFDSDWISIRSTDGKTWDTVADLRREHNLKLPDAVHAATAIRWGLRVLETFDQKDLIKLDGMIGDPPLKIRAPIFRKGDGPLPLFDKPAEGED